MLEKGGGEGVGVLPMKDWALDFLGLDWALRGMMFRAYWFYFERRKECCR